MNMNTILIRNQSEQRGHCLSKEGGSSSPPRPHAQGQGPGAGSALPRPGVFRAADAHSTWGDDTWRELEKRDF